MQHTKTRHEGQPVGRGAVAALTLALLFVPACDKAESPPSTCKAGELRCDPSGRYVEICAKKGDRWRVVDKCSGGEVCAQARCVAAPDGSVPPKDLLPGESHLDATSACPPPRLLCGKDCVDTQTSAAHCGRCDRACPATMHCAAGHCACPKDKPTLCGNDCVDTRSSAAHCGACGKTCWHGACVQSACDEGFVAIEAGDDFTLLLTSAGTVYAWGWGAQGALGQGDTKNRDRPTPITSLKDITQITAQGGHACALDKGGEVYCWGDNEKGQVGDGSFGVTKTRLSPYHVTGVKSIKRVVAGIAHTCALDKGGDVYCWGNNSKLKGSGSGVGCGSTPYVTSPCKVPVSAVTTLSLGKDFTCIAQAGGSVWCWGDNDSLHHQLGTTKSNDPIDTPPGYEVKTFPKLTTMLSKDYGTCVITPGGKLHPFWCWGVLAGSIAYTPQFPNTLGSPSSVTKGVPGKNEYCYIETRDKKPSRLVCSGCPDISELESSWTCRGMPSGPKEVPGLDGVLDVAIGRAHICAITRQKALCWGSNKGGKLGVGTAATSSRVPLPIASP